MRVAEIIGSDVSTDDFGNSHLDVRVRFPGLQVGDDLLSFHLLAIPLFDESHRGESLFNLFEKVFDALCPQWKEKIIGSSTDGAPNMTGCYSGFTTRLSNAAAAAGDMFYRVWCLAHQLDLVIKVAMKAIADKGGFPFISILTTIIGWLRRQDTLIRRMGSKCPYYINVRWTSMSQVCSALDHCVVEYRLTSLHLQVLKWLLKNRVTVCDFFVEKEYPSAPPQEWWLIAKVAFGFL